MQCLNCGFPVSTHTSRYTIGYCDECGTINISGEGEFHVPDASCIERLCPFVDKQPDLCATCDRAGKTVQINGVYSELIGFKQFNSDTPVSTEATKRVKIKNSLAEGIELMVSDNPLIVALHCYGKTNTEWLYQGKNKYHYRLFTMKTFLTAGLYEAPEEQWGEHSKQADVSCPKCGHHFSVMYTDPSKVSCPKCGHK